MLSVIIPARNEPYLQKTILDLLKKAVGDIEIIAVLEGYWPSGSEIVVDERVNYIHNTTPKGMRGAINQAVSIARGDTIMKTDAHCLFMPGFDKPYHNMLMTDQTVVVPRRFRLDPEKWQVIEDGRSPVDYEYLDSKDLHGVRWDERANERKGDYFDNIISAQGSCWVMMKDWYKELNLLDEEQFGRFFLEFQEISFKSWMAGGDVKVNKHIWYAHWHKTEGRGYSLENDRAKAVEGVFKLIRGTGLKNIKRPFKDVIEAFLPMPGWGPDWQEKLQL